MYRVQKVQKPDHFYLESPESRDSFEIQEENKVIDAFGASTENKLLTSRNAGESWKQKKSKNHANIAPGQYMSIHRDCQRPGKEMVSLDTFWNKLSSGSISVNCSSFYEQSRCLGQNIMDPSRPIYQQETQLKGKVSITAEKNLYKEKQEAKSKEKTPAAAAPELPICIAKKIHEDNLTIGNSGFVMPGSFPQDPESPKGDSENF